MPIKEATAASAWMLSGTMLAAPQAITASVSNNGVGRASAAVMAQMSQWGA